MRHYNKTRNIKRKLRNLTRRIKKGRTKRLLFKSKVLGKQLRKLSKKFIQRGGLQQRGGAPGDATATGDILRNTWQRTPAGGETTTTADSNFPSWIDPANDAAPAAAAAAPATTKKQGALRRAAQAAAASAGFSRPSSGVASDAPAASSSAPTDSPPDAPVPPLAAGGDDDDGTPADAPVDQPATADAGATGTTAQSRRGMTNFRKAAARATGIHGAFSHKRSPAAGVPAQPPSAPAAGSAPETFVIPKNTYTQKLLQTLRDNDLTVEKPMGGEAVWNQQTAALLGRMEFTRDELVEPPGETSAAGGPSLDDITNVLDTMGDRPPTSEV